MNWPLVLTSCYTQHKYLEKEQFWAFKSAKYFNISHLHFTFSVVAFISSTYFSTYFLTNKLIFQLLCIFWLLASFLPLCMGVIFWYHINLKIWYRGWWIKNLCQLHFFPGSSLWGYCRGLPDSGKFICWQMHLSGFTLAKFPRTKKCSRGNICSVFFPKWK